MATEVFALVTEAEEILSTGTLSFSYSHSMQSSDGSESSCPSPSLWSLIAEHAPESELPKICAALGCSLVDMYTELHTEAVMWHNMWKEKQQGSSRAYTPLPDPPAIKDLVRAEVQMLLQNLKAKVKREGRDDKEILARYKTKTLNYVLGCPDGPEDANTGSSRATSQCSVQSTSEEEIEAVREKLNAIDINEVVEQIRSALLHECQVLQTQVQLIQGSIRKQCRQDSDADPTLSELKELRVSLQTHLESYTSPASSTASTSPNVTNRGLSQCAGQGNTWVFRPHPPPAGPRFKSSPSLRPLKVHRSTFVGAQMTYEPEGHTQQDVPRPRTLMCSSQFPKRPGHKSTSQDLHHLCRIHGLSREASAQTGMKDSSASPSHASCCSDNGSCVHAQDCNIRATDTGVWMIDEDKTDHAVVRSDSASSSPERSENARSQTNSGEYSSCRSQQGVHETACILPQIKHFHVLLSPKDPAETVLESSCLQQGANIFHRPSLKHEC